MMGLARGTLATWFTIVEENNTEPPAGTFTVDGIQPDDDGQPVIVMAPTETPAPPDPVPDNRVKLSEAAKAEIIERVASGEAQTRVAAQAHRPPGHSGWRRRPDPHDVEISTSHP